MRLRLLDRQPQVLNSKWVLRPDVYVAFCRADRVRAYDHPFEDRVGIAFADTAVHERSRVTLVRVADQVFRRPFRAAAEAPLHAGRESSSAAAPKTALRDLVDHLLR